MRWQESTPVLTEPVFAEGRRDRFLTLAALSVMAVLSLGIGGCKRGGGTDAAAPKATPAVALATQVSTTPAKTESISETVVVTGALNSLNDVTVGVKVNGRITAVFGREGDQVRVGQVVAQQDPADLRAQRDQSAAALTQQRANLAVARTKLQQAEVAYRNSQTTLNWTDKQTAVAVKQAQAGLEQSRQQEAIVQDRVRPQERQQAEENVAAAKADRDKARADLKRYQDLYRQQAVSAQQLDQAQAVTDSAEARYNSAVQALSLLKEGARPEERRQARAVVDQATQTVAQAQSNRAQVELRRADVENARVGVISARASVGQAEAAVKQAEAALRLAEQALADTSIRSPIDGIIAERKVEPGTQASTAKGDVMRIVALDAIYFDAQLPEVQYAEVQPNQLVEVTVDALPGKTFRGTVQKLFPIASTAARSFTVRIALQNEGKVLRPQMFARGTITLKTRSQAVVVPRVALLDLQNNAGRVFVAVGGKAEERKVKTGIVTIQKAEILEGVKVDEQVITVGQAQMQDDAKIEVVAPSGKTASATTQSAPTP